MDLFVEPDESIASDDVRWRRREIAFLFVLCRLDTTEKEKEREREGENH